jgi:succinoglycan biosynthesis transport protein ExoP
VAVPCVRVLDRVDASGILYHSRNATLYEHREHSDRYEDEPELAGAEIIEDTPVDTSLVDSQVQLLSSESIILPVIKSMNLARDSEFVGPPDALGALILWQIKEVINSFKQFIGLNDKSTVDTDTLLERAAAETFLKRLTPKREDVTYVIHIGFASEDPNKAARIANAVADTYFATTLEAKYRSTKMASQWLQDRLIELKGQATSADLALQNYKAANNIMILSEAC